MFKNYLFKFAYEYSDYVTDTGNSIEFDSYMIPEDTLENGQLRLLDVDNRVIVPVDTHIRLIVTGITSALLNVIFIINYANC